jgi:hypothetical protein
MHFPATGEVRTRVGFGWPYRDVEPSSSSSITFGMIHREDQPRAAQDDTVGVSADSGSRTPTAASRRGTSE